MNSTFYRHPHTYLGRRASTENKLMRQEAILPLYHTFAAGPLQRGEFAQMSELGERTARTLLAPSTGQWLASQRNRAWPDQFWLATGRIAIPVSRSVPGSGHTARLIFTPCPATHVAKSCLHSTWANHHEIRCISVFCSRSVVACNRHSIVRWSAPGLF